MHITDFKAIVSDKGDYDGIKLAFESVFGQEFQSDRAVELQAFREFYVGIGGKVKDFDAMAKAYTDERKEWEEKLDLLKSGQQPLNAELVGVTRFGKPYPELRCGKWIADSQGVRVPQERNIKTASRYPITWVATLKNVNTGRFKVKLAFKKRGRWQELITDKSVIVDKSKICSLASFDFPVTSDTNGYLVEYLADLEYLNERDISLIRSTGKLGWQEGRTEEFFPYSTDSELVFDAEQDFGEQFQALTPKGSYDKWLEAVRRIRRGGRIEPLFILAASFASPLLKPLNVQTFCVSLWGNTGGGKSLTFALAASIWADPAQGRYITDFQSTDVMFEVYQNYLNSLPLIVDDSATAKNRAFFSMSDFVYKRCKEKGKGRSDKNLGVHDGMSWRQVVIVNGEQPTVTEDMQGGAINRTLDLACGQGDIYGDKQQSRELAVLLHENYAHAGAEFMTAMLNTDREALRELYSKQLARVSELDGMQKQSNSLAAILLADELAERYIFKDGVHIPIEAAASVLSSKDFVSEDKRCYDYLCDQLSIHRDRFVPIDTAGDRVYKGEIWGCVDGEYLVIIRTVFDTLCREAGYSGKRFLNWAKAQGVILCDSRGYPAKTKRIGNSSPRCVFLKLPDDDQEDFSDGIPF